MSQLYEITGELLTLQELLENGVEDEALTDTLEVVNLEYKEKLENCCKVIKNIEADINAYKIEIDRLTAKRKVLENSVDKLKKAMFESMKTTNTDKVKGTLFTLAIQKNGGKIPVIVDPNANTANLPDELVIVTEKPNLDAIREQLENGNTIDGFSLGERGESLRIK